MKFTGEIRIPEVDHPGIPATILVEDKQIEVVVDGESLGRWSLVDVRARRLISSAFQLDLDGEELTFIADEPIDFAYRGVEQMAEVWAKINSLGPLKRTLAVRSSRSGVKPSRVGELRAAMEANLKVERRSFLSQVETAPKADSPAKPTESPEPVGSDTQSSMPDDAATGGDRSRMGTGQVDGDRAATQQAEASLLAEERARLEEERARLEGERQRLEELRREAEERDAQRIEAFRLEMSRLEAERLEHDKIEAERAELFQTEMENLQKERERLEELEKERSTRAGEDEIRAQGLKEEMARIESARLEMELAEAERVASAQAEVEAVNARRLELEEMEAEHLQRERLGAERLAQLEAERAEAERAEVELIAAEQEALEQAEAGDAEPDAVPADEDGHDEPGGDEEALTPPASSDGKAGSAKEMVVDLGAYEDVPAQPVPEPALAAVGREKAGFMGAVRSAFTRGGRSHEHEFVEAPGGLGIARSICRECGFVSISSTD